MKTRSLHLLILFATVATLGCQPLQAQLSGKYPGYETKHFAGLRYGLFKPTGYDPAKSYPLIVYLHGAGDTVSRDISWYREAVQRNNPAFVLTPKCLETDQGWGNTWADGYTPCMEKTVRLVDDIIASYPINSNRLYLYGISMGGFGVFSVLAKEPGKFAAAYAVCGGSSPKAAQLLTDTPLWIFHGEEDDVVPVSLSRDVYHEMVRLGGKAVRYTEYAGVKHNSWENVDRETTLIPWLLAQEKGKAAGKPARVMKVTAKAEGKAIKLSWQKPAATSPGEQVWFCRIFRDATLHAEVSGEATSWEDAAPQNGSKAAYTVVAVNYLFGESEPAAAVEVR